jgi:hypothetical protein
MKDFSLFVLIIAVLFIIFLPCFSFAQCTDDDSDGYYYEEGCGTPRDCSDANPSINPGAAEICNGLDDNCDGSLDEGCDTTCFYPKKEGSDIRETNDADISEYPSLVWTGSEYGVAWADERNPPKSNKEIYFARLDSSGNKIGSDVKVSNDSDISEYPSLIWTGNGFGVAWTDLRQGNEEIYFSRLDSSGNIIGSESRITNDDSISEFPHLIWTGNEYGIVWSDFRDGNTEIYFTRLDSIGSKIGSDIRITYDNDSSYLPSLIRAGDEYGVAWRDRRDGIYEIYFAQLNSSGGKIGSDVRVTEDASVSDNPSLVWTGSEFGVTWEDNRDGPYEIYFTRIDSLGNKLGQDIRLTQNNSISEYPSLAWNGTEYGISWGDDRDGEWPEIYFTRLNAYGNKVGSNLRVTNNSSSSYNASLVWNGVEYGVSWGDDRDGNEEIYFARIECCDPAVDADLDFFSECEDCNDNDGDIYLGAPEICDGKDNDCDGTIDEDLSTDVDEDGHYTLDSCWAPNDDCDDTNPDAYPGAGETFCNGIDENCDGTGNESPDSDSDGYDACGSGDIINPDGQERDCNDGDASINPGASETCDGYDNNCDATLDEVCDTICDNPNKWGSEINISEVASFLFAPSLAWSGSEYGASWEDDRNLNYEIYFARLDSSGSRIGSSIRITNDFSSSQEPSIIWKGEEYGISWRDTRNGNEEIYFARLDSSGSKIGTDVRVTYDDSSSYEPSLVWTGDRHGIAWHDYRDGNNEIYFARLDSSGTKLGTDVRVTTFTTNSSSPSIVWTGNEYGISWYDTRDGNAEIYFARMDASGEKIGSDLRITSDSNLSEYPSLIWAGDLYGLAWHDFRDGNYEIYFARLDASGSKVGSDLRITGDVSDSFHPSLKWTGNEFGLAWNDSRDGNEEIYFGRIDSLGNKIGSETRVTENSSSSQYSSLVWAGSEYGVSWYDSSFGSGDIYFNRIICCGNISNKPTTGLVFGNDKQTMNWDVVAEADRYDVVKGDLESLRSSLGDYTNSLRSCLEDDSTNTQTIDTDNPTAPNEGFYYLVRAHIDCRNGTYNTSQASQVGDRDAEIENSINRCP